MKRITDPTFKYRGAATHEDGGRSFHRRMQARKRLMQRKARQQTTATATVAPITKQRTKASA